MKTIKKMSTLLLLLSLFVGYTSCDGELIDETTDEEVVDPGEEDNNTDEEEEGGSEGEDGDDNNEGETDQDGDRPVIEGQTFTEQMIIDGEENNGLIIRNCTFENTGDHGIIIKNVDDLLIQNCTFRNLKYTAIRFWHDCESNNVIVEDNEIYNIDANGIHSAETHYNTIIRNNKIYDVALEPEYGSHGMYFYGKDFLIEGNTVYNVGVQVGKGAGINVRTAGIVRKNKVYNAHKHGISYSCNHPGYNGTLLIENNVVYDNKQRGINIYDGPDESKIGKAIIRFNTVISTSNEAPIWINTGGYPNATFEVYANVLINTGGSSVFVKGSSSHPIEFESKNLTATNDVGFENFEARDLRIKSSSSAKNYAVGLSDYPKDDINNADVRKEKSLDAGAYEVD
ncbi:MAG: right-handed parallel beta-helix repeat-containing protein [Marinifilum sp.]|jgi:hypothetical protein|nr:right-handed parallel beta-helix repeat-containing protein [Marinifilum sp.]